jgi:serine/threonine protein kinase
VKLVQIHDPSLVKRFTREHIFFGKLIGPLVPNLIWAANIGKKYCMISRWVDATSINQMEARALAIIICPNGLYWFENQLHRICDHPEKNGVSHRDLCDTNIILSHDRVYLIDMGLAIFKDEYSQPVKRKFQDRDDRKHAATLLNHVQWRVELYKEQRNSSPKNPPF